MAPTAKDVETPTVTPVVPAAKASPEPQTRPQPVPLEVSVSVNGARTIEGTDKREPFSESTKTVLVFANGAVIRLAANVAPGQLLFVTNEKTKKEVVCQVVKSKNYRTVTGYVELEFTEPAAGFWGVRIPTETPAAAPLAPKPPVAARPAAPTAVPPAGTVAGKPPAPAPLAAKPTLPALAPVKPPSRPASVAPGNPAAAAPPAPVGFVTPTPVLPQPEIKSPAATELAVSPIPIAPAQQLTAQVVAILNTSPSSPQVQEPQPPAPMPATTASKATPHSTEELRQQAARLQEQLSSLLFREESAEKKPASVAIPVPVEPLRELVSSPKPQAEAAAPVISTPEKPATASQVEARPIPTPAGHVSESKPLSPAIKPSTIHLQGEEVRIPSWLAPLARDTESATQTSVAFDPTALPDSESATSENAFLTSEATSAGSQSVVFGGQLLGGGSAAQDQKTSSSRSKKRIIIGIAAAAALLAGGVWYEWQPGNFLASNSAPVLSSNNAISLPATPAPVGNPISATPAGAPSSTPAAAAQPTTVVSPAVSRVSNGSTNAEAKSVNSTPPATAEAAPRKPILGPVRLATPNVNRNASAGSNDSAPSIDSGGAASAEPLPNLDENNAKQPTAPLPVGGEVQPAKLLKSTPPVYPPSARTQRVSGDVVIDALIDASGNVTTTKVLSGPVLLHAAAVAALKQWKYQAAKLDGKPTSMHLNVTVQFRLQ